MKTKVLLLLWHPENAVAGGFIRTKVLLSYFRDIDLTVLDNYPSFISHSEFQHVAVKTYTIPRFILNIYKLHFALGRLFEWMAALFFLIKIGSSELKRGDYQVIYGPTGDNLHIFLAGVLLKLFFPSKKLLLDVLNLEMPEGSARLYFNSFKRNNIGLLFALSNTMAMIVLLFLEKKLISYCDHVVTVSPYMKKVISKYFPEEKISVTPSGVTTQYVKGIKQSRKTIDGLYVGRHTKEKGIFDVLAAWQKVKGVRKKTNLETIGFAPNEIQQSLQEKVDRLNLQENVKFNGMLSEKDKWEKYKRAKVFLHLAYHEPLVPVITILEALVCGIPVVNYDVPAVDDYPFLRKSPALVLVKNGDIDAAAKAVLRLLDLSEKEQKKISAAAEQLAKRFSWREIAQIEEKVIKNLARM